MTGKVAALPPTLVCKTCLVEKPATRKFFYGNRKTLYKVCKPCQITRLSAAYKAAPWKHRIGELRRKFGMSPEQYEDMLCEQDWKCAICRDCFSKDKRAPHVDHDHDTGKVRALLCHGCNTGLGNLQDSLVVLAKATAYLEFHHARR